MFRPQSRQIQHFHSLTRQNIGHNNEQTEKENNNKQCRPTKKKKTKPIKAKRLGWENGFGKYWPTVQYANGFERILHTNCTPLISQLNHK